MSLVHWWPLTKDTRDYGTNPISLTANNLSTSTLGKLGSCYTFNGSNSSLAYTKGAVVSGRFTVALWVKSNSSSATQCLFCNRGSTAGTGPAIFIITGTSIRFDTENTSCSASYPTDLAWHHLVCSYDGKKRRIYLDGILKTTESTTSSLGTTSNYFTFGGSGKGSTATNNWFNGSINDYRIYDHVLSLKEIKELAKGLCLHYNFDGDREIEGTTNLCNSIIPAIYSGSETITATQLGTNSYRLKNTPKMGSYDPIYLTWDSWGYDVSSYIGQKITFSATIKNIKFKNILTDNMNSWFAIGQANNGTYPNNLELSGTGNFIKYAAKKAQEIEGTRLVWTGTIQAPGRVLFEISSYANTVQAYAMLDLENIQVEVKDHATPYTESSRGIVTQYDKTIYTESDGSLWLRIAHHNNPASGNLFSSSDTFSTGVYKDADRWFDVFQQVQASNSYEFMVKQKTTSSATETKYRWIQYTSPLTATYNDVAPAKVARITTSGYTDGGYGGLYILNSSTYMCIANTNNGNWFGAFGAWSAYSGGIPGYPNTAITTGYMDLYIRIPGIPQIVDCSGFKNHGKVYNGEIVADSSNGFNSVRLNGTNAYIDTGSSFNNLFSGGSTPFTVSFWVYNNEDSNGAGRGILFGNYEGSSAGKTFNLEVNGGSTSATAPRFYWKSGYPDVACNSSLLTHHAWTYLTVTYDGSSVKIYKNGEQKNTYSSVLGALEPSHNFWIGNDHRSDGQFFKGQLADFKLFATALSESDVLEEYNRQISIDRNGNLYCKKFVEEYGDIKFLRNGNVSAAVLDESLYKRVEYIQSTGTQYINTNSHIMSNSRIEAEIMFDNAWDWNFMYGGWPYFSLALCANNGLTVNSTNNPITDTESIFASGLKYTIVHTPTNITIGDQTFNISYGNFTTGDPIYLFASSDKDDSYKEIRPHSWVSYGKGKIYYLKIYSGDSLQRDYIPVIRIPDNNPGLYDLIGRKFYPSESSTQLVAGPMATDNLRVYDNGYKKLEYIQSTGSQYIDTGVKLNNNISTEIEFSLTETTSSETDIFGADISPYPVIGTLNSKFRFRVTGTFQNYSIGVDTSRHNIMWSSTSIVFDRIKLVNGIAESYSLDKSAYLFAANTNSGVNYLSKSRIYSCKIYNNYVLIRDFIPVKDKNNNIGLYDIIHNKFYPNDGGGSFTAGPELGKFTKIMPNEIYEV